MYISKGQVSRRIAMIICSISTVTAIALSPLATAQDSVLEEITVTAQKREQSLQQVGISVAAISGDQMRELGIESSEDVQHHVAGMESYNYTGSGAPQYFIRGVGTADFAQNTPPTTPLYVDDVYVSSSVVSSILLFDMEGVEVLRGPQGTLFGRNTVGGAVSYRTKQPSEDSDGYLTFDAGDFETFGIEGAVGGAISDSARFRVAAKVADQGEGYYENSVTGFQQPDDGMGRTLDVTGDRFWNADSRSTAGGGQSTAVRAALSVDFTNKLAGTFSASYAEFDGTSQTLNSVGFVGGNCPFAADNQSGAFDAANCSAHGFVDLQEDFSTGNGYIGDQEMEGTALLAKFAYALDSGAEFTSITSWTDGEQFLGTDTDGTPARIAEKNREYEVEAFTQEFRIASESDSGVYWLAGAFYSDDTNRLFDAAEFSQELFGPNFGLTNFANPAMFDPGAGVAVFIDATAVLADQDTETRAAFFHTEWPLSDNWMLTVAGRYTSIDKDFTNFTNFIFDDAGAAIINGIDPTALNGTVPNAALGDTNGTGPGFVDDSATYDKFTPKVAVNWTPTDSSLYYLSYSQGFREGGFEGNFVLSASVAVPYSEETLDAIEAGWKIDFDRVRFNGAIYRYDYKDVQQRTTSLDSQGVPANFIANVGDLEQKGIEAEILWLPNDNLTVQAAISLLDQEISITPTQAAVNAASPATTPLVREGDVFPYAPEFSATLLARWDQPLASGRAFFIQGDAKFSDDYYTTAENVEAIKQSAYSLFNARVGVRGADDRWDVALWGRNLTDEKYITQAYALFQNYVIGTNRPRNWGITYNHYFN